ncbi:MAG TPA: trypsin-like peptidase domain-containing protein [Candidatus Polarisedimenticolaceae bacterium]|nr:trypsin-like peptidase domain-containing protein [Candidatus Polarisedimenticolaceae bacterium]
MAVKSRLGVLPAMVALAVLPALAAGTVELERRPAASEPVVETFGEPGGLGADPWRSALQMTTNHQWLVEQRAPIAGEPGITIRLTEQDRINIGELPCADCDGRVLLHPDKMRVGVVKDVAPAVRFGRLTSASLARGGDLAGGTLRPTGGGFVWTLVSEAEGAKAQRIHFTGFDLPEGTEVWVYNDAGEAYGPYRGRGLTNDADFWSDSIGGSRVYIQVHDFGPAQNARLHKIRFDIPEVAYLGHYAIDTRPEPPSVETNAFCSFNASCIVNASCSTIPSAVQNTRSAIAHMQWVSGAFIYICTGGLLADTDSGSQIPLFLTANHCLSRAKEAKVLEAFFQFSTSCGGSCPQPFTDPPGVPKVVGADVLSTSTNGDYTLLRLKQNPPVGSFFMGWNNTAVANTNGASLYRISHPSGAPQAYSTHSVDTSAPTCSGLPRGGWIYSRDTLGGTEGGSSGSPVVNASGQVVGQLTGACGTNVNNVCDVTHNATVDGALAGYYANVASFLDPTPGGGGACDGDGTCESGENCNNCAADCPGQSGGPPSGRFCCGDGVAQSAEGGGAICDGNF